MALRRWQGDKEGEKLIIKELRRDVANRWSELAELGRLRAEVAELGPRARRRTLRSSA
jgi:hypothetical protein